MPSDQMIGADASGVERPMRDCTRSYAGLDIGCGKVDDHPRHVIDTGRDEEIQFHLDCHAAAGCASCRERIADRPDGATGAELLEHVSPGATTTTSEEG